jgi:hypothetical protein
VAAIHQEDTFPDSLSSLGFNNAPPSDYTPYNYNLFGHRLAAWKYTGDDIDNDGFHVFRPNVDGLTSEDTAALQVTYWADNRAPERKQGIFSIFF